MEALKTTLLLSTFVIGIIWLAVFICALSDKLRGYQPPPCTCAEEQKSGTPKLPRTWRQHVVRAPLYLVFLLFAIVLGVLSLPMIVLDRLWSARSKPTGRT
jgi:hypothetical protein